MFDSISFSTGSFSEVSWDFGTPAITTPPCYPPRHRVHTIKRERREYTVKTDARMHLVNFERRCILTALEKRVYTPAAENRLILIQLEKRQKRILQ